MHKVWSPFLEQMDRRVVELWQAGDWKTFCEMLPLYNEKCWGEGGMHDTAMLLGALGWDRYDGKVEVVTPYFGSSGTGQINAIFPSDSTDRLTCVKETDVPHLTLEYSANLADAESIGRLCDTLAQCLAEQRDNEQRVFPPGGIRVRALRCEHYCIADGRADAAFLHANLKIAQAAPMP